MAKLVVKNWKFTTEGNNILFRKFDKQMGMYEQVKEIPTTQVATYNSAVTITTYRDYNIEHDVIKQLVKWVKSL